MMMMMMMMSSVRICFTYVTYRPRLQISNISSAMQSDTRFLCMSWDSCCYDIAVLGLIRRSCKQVTIILVSETWSFPRVPGCHPCPKESRVVEIRNCFFSHNTLPFCSALLLLWCRGVPSPTQLHSSMRFISQHHTFHPACLASSFTQCTLSSLRHKVVTLNKTTACPEWPLQSTVTSSIMRLYLAPMAARGHDPTCLHASVGLYPTTQCRMFLWRLQDIINMKKAFKNMFDTWVNS